MDRRELLRMIALATGSALIGGEVFLTGCNNPDQATGTGQFSENDIAFLDEVGETILPKTSSAGAKEAKIGEFMRTMVNDCYTKQEQDAFHEGIKKLDEACNKLHGHSFMKAAPEERKDLLIVMDQESKEVAAKKREFDREQSKRENEEFEKGNKAFKKATMPAHYFTMMKQLTILGYFTSKEGRNSALRFNPVPGKYDGNLDYKKGDKLFAGLN